MTPAVAAAERPPIADPMTTVQIVPTYADLGLGSRSDWDVAMSSNGMWVAIQRPDDSTVLWSAQSGTFTTLPLQGTPNDVSDNGRYVLLTADDASGNASVFEVNTSNNSVTQLSTAGSFTQSDGARISADGTTRAFWDSESGMRVLPRTGAPTSLSDSGMLSSDGTTVTTFVSFGSQKVIDVATMNETFLSAPNDVSIVMTARDGVSRLGMPSDGGVGTNVLALGADDSTLWSHDVDNTGCCLVARRGGVIAEGGAVAFMGASEVEGTDQYPFAFRFSAAGIEEIVIDEADDNWLIPHEVSKDGTYAVFSIAVGGQARFVHANFGDATTPEPPPPPPPPVQTGGSGEQLNDQIRRLFSAYFGRAPDAPGLEFWARERAQGTPLETVSQAFADSPEFVANYGTLSDDDFVELVYANVLERSPDADGKAFWVDQLAQGLSRGELMIGFSEGAEFVAKTGTAAPSGQFVGSIVRLFTAYFDRGPDQVGLEFWVDQRASGRSLASVSDAFAQSPEFEATYGSLSNGEFVDLIYANVLGRPADADGRQFWIDELDRGVSRGSLMIGFSESPENLLKTQTLP